MSTKKAMHYSGECIWRTNNSAHYRFAGGPVCCSDHAHEKIQAAGNHTRNGFDVTCRRCIKIMALADVRPRPVLKTNPPREPGG